MDLQGQTALVTGSSRGIGRAIAEELGRRPLELLLCGVRGDAPDPPAAPAGGAREIRNAELDLSTPESIERGAAALPPVDLLASVSGYAWFPAATTYAAAKTGVVALSESLRRELEGTGVNVLHLVTPTSPEEWAAKVVRAV